MGKTLVYVFDSLAHGESARETLIHAGFPATKIHVTANNDEAGAVEGNFCVGNARTTEDVTKLFDSLIEEESTGDDCDQN